MTIPYITALFAGVFGIMQVPMTLMVGLYRVKSGIWFMDQGDKVLLRRMRAHANYTENVPIVLILMLVAEMMFAPAGLLYACGISLLLGRIMHSTALLTKRWSRLRPPGMILTLLPMGILGIWLFIHAIIGS